MRKMGGLRKYMPATRMTMLIACFAIAGIFPLAGFFSKDEILAGAWNYNKGLWIVGFLTAGLTAFYMFRLYFMTFSGEYRAAHVVGIPESEPQHAGHQVIPAQPHLDQGDAHSDKAHGHHADSHDPHESPASMTGVLWILAVLSVIGGFVGWPFAHPIPFQHWLEPILLPVGSDHFHFHHGELGEELLLMGASLAVAVTGILLAMRFYKKDESFATPKRIAARFPFLHRLLSNKYYVDELYNATAIYATLVFSRFLSWFDANIVDGVVNLTRHITVYPLGHGSSLFDRYIVDGAVNGAAYAAGGASRFFRRMQSGFVQNYALIMASGIVLIAAVYLFMKP
jgi:NADH:ubiquinone oxidoreductase subunit 5 (subunit L)/multisubunit Na+/H+ antiporter MnhA subunit